MVSTEDFAGARWRKSSRSGSGDNNACVEVAAVGATVGVRDSKNRGGSHLMFDGSAWRALTDALR